MRILASIYIYVCASVRIDKYICYSHICIIYKIQCHVCLAYSQPNHLRVSGTTKRIVTEMNIRIFFPETDFVSMLRFHR